MDWISINERKPSNRFICTIEHFKPDHRFSVRTLLYHNGSWLFEDTEEPLGKNSYVTHWMPYPEPIILKEV